MNGKSHKKSYCIIGLCGNFIKKKKKEENTVKFTSSGDFYFPCNVREQNVVICDIPNLYKAKEISLFQP